MMTRIIKISILFIILACMYYYFVVMSSRNLITESTNSEAQHLAKNDHDSATNQSHANATLNPVDDISVVEPDHANHQKYYLNKCGTDSSNFLVSILGNLGERNLSSAQLSVIHRLEKECMGWFDHLSSLSDDEVATIEADSIDHLKIRFDFAALSSVDKFKQALSVLKGESASITKGMAIGYLIKFDSELINLVADSIGTTNHIGITSNSREIVTLYDCKIGTFDCGQNGMLMITNCLYNEAYCGMDFYAMLEHDLTYNEVNHLHNIVDALFAILEEDYP